MKLRLRFFLAALALGCGTEQPDPEPASSAASERVLTPLLVDVSQKHQRIVGFGASSAWTAPTLSPELAEQFFSPDTGLGLSLLRIQIRPEGGSWEFETADIAASYGAAVWASPWSPSEELKTNGSTVGGKLKPESYTTWAQTLADFAVSMRERGTPLLAISAQNEPDYDAPWDSCVFTATELADFVASHLAPALASVAPEVKIIAPESANWTTLREYGDALLAQPAALDSLFAVAVHEYGGSAFRYDRLFELGQQLWVTETSDGNEVTDPGMTSALSTAFQINAAMTRANVSAWHYWWLLPRTDIGSRDTNAALTDTNLELTKRAYALGNFARFIRPEFQRVETSGTLARQVAASGYLSADEQTLVTVLISDRIDSVEQTISVPGMQLTSAELWITDAERSLEAATSQPQITNAAGGGVEIQISLPTNSVVTLIARTADAAAEPDPVIPGSADAGAETAPAVSDG